MTILSIMNEKGGSGKTTTAQHIAVDKACTGNKVLFIDTDKQRTGIKFFARNHMAFPNGYDGVIDATFSKPSNLQQTIAKYKGKYDYIYIDTPPSVDEFASDIIGLSDIVLVACQPKFKDVEAAENMVEVINHHKKINPNLKAGFVVTRKPHNENVDSNLDKMAKLGIHVFDTHITQYKAYELCDEKGVGIIHLDHDAHSSVVRAASEVHSLASEIASYVAR